jgi:hypothetical protein
MCELRLCYRLSYAEGTEGYADAEIAAKLGKAAPSAKALTASSRMKGGGIKKKLAAAAARMHLDKEDFPVLGALKEFVQWKLFPSLKRGEQEWYLATRGRSYLQLWVALLMHPRL